MIRHSYESSLRFEICKYVKFKIIRRGYDSLELMGVGLKVFFHMFSFVCKSHDLRVRFSVCYNVSDWLLLVTCRPK